MIPTALQPHHCPWGHDIQSTKPTNTTKTILQEYQWYRNKAIHKWINYSVSASQGIGSQYCPLHGNECRLAAINHQSPQQNTLLENTTTMQYSHMQQGTIQPCSGTNQDR
jgi:hypothetical protein